MIYDRIRGVKRGNEEAQRMKSLTVEDILAAIDHWELSDYGDKLADIPQLEARIAADDNDLEAHHELGMTFVFGRDYDKAERHLRRALSLSKGREEEYYILSCLGEICFRKGAFYESANLYHDAIKAGESTGTYNTNPEYREEDFVLVSRAMCNSGQLASIGWLLRGHGADFKQVDAIKDALTNKSRARRKPNTPAAAIPSYQDSKTA